MLQALTPMLRTWDLAGSVEFYTEILGFECEGYSEEFTWASLKRDGVSIMFSGPNEHLDDKEPVFTGSLYINTDDVEAVWNQLKEKARVCYPIETFPYGMREFAIYDNNGYLIQFGQEAESDEE